MTFVELTVVVTIMGLLAVVGVPRFARALHARKARHAAIQLASYVDYVRNTAINEGRSVTLSVDATGDRFWSPDVDFPDQVGVPLSVLIKDRFDDGLEIKASFDSATSVTFDLEGTPHVGGTPLGDGVIVIGTRAVAYEIRFGAGPGNAAITEVNNPDEDAFSSPEE
ncbi:Type II transport protein GspH [Stieleria neptunia]|uniref:Type II secretion system protein H n=2 Tax=Stieleria neptunia TaxID=2527979 RepID=A0A518I470_9BACT|nr:Type II transport protein GspH [Stieleria neptunia]